MANRILLGLLMLVPGLVKLFVFGHDGVTGMLSGFGFPMASFFAWVLIAAEILAGLSILGNWKVEYFAWLPVIIFVIAGFLTSDLSSPGAWSGFLMHITLASNYALIAMWAKSSTHSGMHEMKSHARGKR